MARATISKELHFECAGETGTLGFITITLRDAGINIIHLLGYSAEGKAFFQIILSDAEKAQKVLSAEIKNVVIRDVLIVEFENKLGTLSDVAKLLGQNSVDISECYGTSSDGFKIVGIFSTDDNAKAAKLINAQSGHLAS